MKDFLSWPVMGRIGSAVATILLMMPAMTSWAQDPAEPASSPDARQGYLVRVELPLVGQRDDIVRQQILRIAETSGDGGQRPVVVLRFVSTPLVEVGGEIDNGGLESRGSQFERSLALARFLTSREAAKVRLVAYVEESVEGHAVLPVLACEEIVATSDAELGRAAIDEPADPTVIGAYRDVLSRRATLPEPIVMAMLDPTAEAYQLELANGSGLVANKPTTQQLRDKGEILKEETLWLGGGLAKFNGQQMRNRRWIARTISDPSELPAALGLSGTLRSTQQLPRQWRPVSLQISGQLNAGRVNQIIRSLDAAQADEEINLVVIQLSTADSDFVQASRLASYVADLRNREVYTLGVVLEPVAGPISLVTLACQEAVLLREASLSPASIDNPEAASSDTRRRVLDNLASVSGRPLPFMSALVEPQVEVHEYVHQGTGRKSVFADWQIAGQADPGQWLVKQKIAGGNEPISSQIALRYGLIDAVEDSLSITLSRLGVQETPPSLQTPWLDSSIQMLLAQGWLPRLLLTIGFFALMIEFSNPGLGVGGFFSALCFLGFFWIEGLNGNVEWLEILLFVAGLIALLIELFVVPGFGLFGIGGLLMLLVSVVLASQTFIWPTTSAQLTEVSENLFWVACLALLGMISLLFMHKQLERSPVLRWVTLQPTGTEAAEELSYREALSHREHLLGQSGLTTTRLNPSGKAQFGRDLVDVVGTGRLIDAGVPVRVVEVRGNLVLVEEEPV